MTSILEKHPLDCYTLYQPLVSPVLRWEFLKGLFDIELDLASISATDRAYESFFHRYHSLCTLAANKSPSINEITHYRFLRVIGWLKNEKFDEVVRCTVLTTVFNEFQSEQNPCLQDIQTQEDAAEVIQTLLDLAASTWLMLTVGKFPGDATYDEPVSWHRKQPLHFLTNLPNKTPLHLSQSQAAYPSVLTATFPPQPSSNDKIKLPQTFTASPLETIGGIQINWTSNLADHLLLRDDDTVLLLFHQISILDLHALSPTSPLPRDLIDETIRTTSLLIPPVLGSPNPWFLRRQQASSHSPLDAAAGLCKRLNSTDRQIENFHYWRDRLVLLKRTFDEAEPRTVRQLWEDDRKRAQWFTFWVAVLVFVMTVVFGVVQSVAGIVQAWASVKALRQG
ncbi:MAG: hypothetical protein OHK93_006385 [Ramalina farinacea]|uniref:Uncharacterized protein n=1 Tax=Ramalina farinacea TaxID=258253 RepID=A0AA43QJX6_9LECA|nr:hypothetical protein [Ramalina farinacea]